ncbi:MAG: indole-3-glycerol phosphate synthase TrpC [Myxococcota bacterium]
MTILDEILARKHDEVVAAKARLAPAELGARARAHPEPTRGFRRALLGRGPHVIAELKRRSPSKGEIRADFDPVAIARAYEAGGAAALSVLTDEHFFGGSLAVLERVRETTALPLLRKDFVIDAYQIDEARVAGADAVLLIVAALTPEALAALREHAAGLGLDVLVEVHDEAELDVAKGAGADLVGINNRDLRTFETDLGVTERLAPRVAEGVVVVAESGIFGPADVARLAGAGASAFLVGESLMREADPGLALRRLLGTP